MAEEHNEQGHSEAYFGEYRDFWWNRDFLDMIAGRLQLGQLSKVLDVGSGLFHWSKLLVKYLKRPVQVQGIDKDPKWAAHEDELKYVFNRPGVECRLKHGEAAHLPWADNSFDLVTCQTLLIHVPEPRKVIAEMKRVLRPGGLLLCVEPNNLVQNLTKSSFSRNYSINDILEHVKYALICEHGKKLLGEGDNSVGDLLPGYVAEAGFEQINVCLSDKAMPMYPPYETDEQLATIEQWENADTNLAGDRKDIEYFKAFGDQYLPFYKKYHEKFAEVGDDFFQQLNDHQYHSAGGAIMYLISATKPAKS